MKVITLIENHSENELACEHGLSFYIEYKGDDYLLDAGQSGLFMANAETLGIELGKVSKAILSHAHYDHAGGFAELAKANKKVVLYMQKAGRNDCFSIENGIMEDIGIPKAVKEAMEKRICYVDGDLQLAEGVYLIAHHTAGLSRQGEKMHMYQQIGDEMVTDDFSHEQSLVFELPEGLVICNSCSHGGVVNIIKEVTEIFKGRPVLAMFGGFHLMGAEGPDSMRDSEEEVRRLGEQLLKLDVSDIYTGHCTGTKAFPILKEVLGERLHQLSSGTEVLL